MVQMLPEPSGGCFEPEDGNQIAVGTDAHMGPQDFSTIELLKGLAWGIPDTNLALGATGEFMPS